MTQLARLLPRVLIVPLMTAALAACAPSTDSAGISSTAPETHTARRPAPDRPKATLTDGTVITLELAVTPEEIGQGLMFRPHLPSDRGMLFLFQRERVPSFWMKDTMIPLDLLFLDGSGTIVEIIADAQPCATEPCPQYVPSQTAWAVLELNAGAAERHGLAAGDTLTFERVEGYPRTD